MRLNIRNAKIRENNKKYNTAWIKNTFQVPKNEIIYFKVKFLWKYFNS